MIKELINLANHLDGIGLRKEADYLDNVILKVSDEGDLHNYREELRRSVNEGIKSQTESQLPMEATPPREDTEYYKLIQHSGPASEISITLALHNDVYYQWNSEEGKWLTGKGQTCNKENVGSSRQSFLCFEIGSSKKLDKLESVPSGVIEFSLNSNEADDRLESS